MCLSLQTSLSFRTAVRAQYKLLTVYGAALFFPQRLQFAIFIGQSLLLLLFNMSCEKSESPNAKEEGDCPQSKCEAQVNYPLLEKILLEDRLLCDLWCPRTTLIRVHSVFKNITFKTGRKISWYINKYNKRRCIIKKDFYFAMVANMD